MTTIASPRPSGAIQSPASARSSISLDRPAQQQGQRRNRTALRDYYNLSANAQPSSPSASSTVPEIIEPVSPIDEIDKDDFDPESHVQSLLANESLEKVLRTEAGLIGAIGGLDGDRKALVYDNYSKLIAATDTITDMRKNMDPLDPLTSTLKPTIAHIEEVSTSLSKNLRDAMDEHDATPPSEDETNTKELQESQEARDTVKWALGAPERLRQLMHQERFDEADAEHDEIKELLQSWKGVDGVEELRSACESAVER